MLIDGMNVDGGWGVEGIYVQSVVILYVEAVRDPCALEWSPSVLH